MANVLTDLAADLYKSADVVSRELVGMIPAVTFNADGSQRVARGDVVRSHATRTVTTIDRNVAMTLSEGTDQTVDNKTIAITKDKSVEIPWTGEDILRVNNGSGFETIYGDQIAQAMRTLTNEIETDLCTAAYLGASRAYGTAGTTPFSTAGDFSDAAYALKMLKDNGAPVSSGASLVIDTTAGAKLIGLQSRYDIAGDTVMQNQGVIINKGGLAIRESAKIQSHTAGTAASATTDNAGYAIGSTTITLASAGSGTILVGDVISFAGDSEKYVVTSGDASVAGGGSITIAAPGLRKAIAASATAITVAATSVRNLAFTRNAVELVLRAPARPTINGVARDAAIDRMMVVDPRSGLPFEASVFVGQGKMFLEIAVAWGYKVWKPEHLVSLLG
jgi:hypothetical protein